jgi:hypothetical protein
VISFHYLRHRRLTFCPFWLTTAQVKIATSLVDVCSCKGSVVTGDLIDKDQDRMILSATPSLTLNHKVCLFRISSTRHLDPNIDVIMCSRWGMHTRMLG